MSANMRFLIPGKPVGQEQARFSKSGTSFRPETKADYEQMVKLVCLEECQAVNPDYAGSVALDIMAYLPFPEDSFEENQQAVGKGERKPLVRPSLDSIVDVVLSGLNQVAWQDKEQVVYLIVNKKYADDPCVAVGIHYLE